ncbi:hypothetical protein IE53DRAFT_167354 [Violaceomyces palustris]|uniref:Uncharacterized protein n=1 Tax=Violaceomyces palustris TaxID=1673888 RepID=A0ACD0NTD3_9BASI|nr:hypothetical protein IE53DRAFT_167354 [Violaceomyces palustris]
MLLKACPLLCLLVVLITRAHLASFSDFFSLHLRQQRAKRATTFLARHKLAEQPTTPPPHLYSLFPYRGYRRTLVQVVNLALLESVSSPSDYQDQSIPSHPNRSSSSPITCASSIFPPLNQGLYHHQSS